MFFFVSTVLLQRLLTLSIHSLLDKEVAFNRGMTGFEVFMNASKNENFGAEALVSLERNVMRCAMTDEMELRPGVIATLGGRLSGTGCFRVRPRSPELNRLIALRSTSSMEYFSSFGLKIGDEFASICFLPGRVFLRVLAVTGFSFFGLDLLTFLLFFSI